MKYLLGVLLTVFIIVCSVACTYDTTTQTATETTYQISISRDAAHFESEEDMVNQIKAGTAVNDQSEIEKLDYYYRLKTLPEGSKLLYIRMKDFYLSVVYITDDQSPNDVTNLINFVWYRTPLEEDLMKADIHAGSPWESMSKNEADSFNTAKNPSLDMSGNVDESSAKVQLCNAVTWTQDGYEFQVNAPVWFTQDDIQKYCNVEKVFIK